MGRRKVEEREEGWERKDGGREGKGGEISLPRIVSKVGDWAGRRQVSARSSAVAKEGLARRHKPAIAKVFRRHCAD